MIDKAAFLKSRLTEREVEVPGVGTVRVRGLSRAEAVEVREVGSDVAAMERLIIRLGLVDPSLTDSEVAEWYGNAPTGEVDLIVNLIVEMSGLAEGAAKSGVPTV